jgi:hypothetical protein
MALSQLFPISLRPLRPRIFQLPSRTTTQIQIVPEIAISSEATTERRSFIMIIISIFLVGLISLLVINTLLTQDAFVLQRLKHQTNLVTDQRDAIVQEVAAKSAPDNLAKVAITLGMIPATNPEFIDISKIISVGPVR